jgi:hypothetical protein
MELGIPNAITYFTSGITQISPRATVYAKAKENMQFGQTWAKPVFGIVTSSISNANDSEHCPANFIPK